MPQSLAHILVHLVFSTSARKPMLHDAWRAELHSYIGGIIRRCGSELLAANSVVDHIHLLFLLPRTVSVADLVRKIKTGATKWIRARDARSADFHWQAGYGIFSISPSHKQDVIRCIAMQPEHHQTISFQDEFRRLLERYGIQCDERYMWD